MRPDESLEAFASRLKSARENIECAEAIVRTLREKPCPVRRQHNEIMRAVEDMRCRALDFISNTEEERREHL